MHGTCTDIFFYDFANEPLHDLCNVSVSTLERLVEQYTQSVAAAKWKCEERIDRKSAQITELISTQNVCKNSLDRALWWNSFESLPVRVQVAQVMAQSLEDVLFDYGDYWFAVVDLHVTVRSV